jgi:NAD(P)-dependent dehydrogenase (short-subunit alcohol dehydrogenase family)
MPKTASQISSFHVAVTRPSAQSGRATADYLAALTAQIPLGRLGSASDIAFSVRFLASDEAGYITGATLDVNGGIARR